MSDCPTRDAILAYADACEEDDAATVPTVNAVQAAWKAWLRVYETTPTTPAGAILLFGQFDALGPDLPDTHTVLVSIVPDAIALFEHGLQPCDLRVLRGMLFTIREAMKRDGAAGCWCGHLAAGLASIERFALRARLVAMN